MKTKFTKNSSYKVIRLTDDESIKLTFDTYYSWEKRNFDVINLPDDEKLIEVLLENNQVDAIVIQYKGEVPELPVLKSLPDYYSRMTITYQADKDYGIDLALNMTKWQLTGYMRPLFSVVTPLYNTNLAYFKEAYNSLKNQSLNDWEWVLVDDSPKPLEDVKKFLDDQKDVRLRYYRIEPTNGNIGLSKWRANCMSRGHWLIEFDHDDMLMWWCLQTIREAIEAYPANRFIYSDNSTIDKDNNVTPCAFGKDYTWGLGYGFSYNSKTPDPNVTLRTDSSGPVTNATVRHIVGVPNHFRCWQRDFYFSIGGHNEFTRIADDYELLLRSFFHTRFTHIKASCYAQRFDGNNSQFQVEQDTDGQGNINDIQRRVRLISIHYDKAIHERLEALGLDDDKWIEGDPYETAHVYEALHRPEVAEDVYWPQWTK